MILDNFFTELTSYGIEFRQNEPMSKHTTFKIGGRAKCFALPKNEEQTALLLTLCRKFNQRVCIIGRGSNMLIDDGDIDCVFICFSDGFGDITLLDDTHILCSAGASLLKVCTFALDNSLSGMEPLYGIPGSVGGGLYMNAGAYGGEMKDVVLSCTAMDTQGNIRSYGKDELDLSYRHSRFSSLDEVILSVVLELKKGNKDDIAAAMKDFMSRRKDKQPLEFPSAGSVFKRPEGYFAGALIEQCDLKGETVGGAQVSPKHAGFIVNTGGATAEDVLTLIDTCICRVREQTGVELEPEIKLFR